MRLRNCPYCYGGTTRRSSYCGFCHGKKKVNSEFVKWDNKRRQKEKKIRKKLESQLEQQVREEIKKWEEKNPKPRKFASK